MRKWLALLLLAAGGAAADERWIEIRSGPFQVLSDVGDRPAREAMNQLEQVRYLLGTALGKPELTTVWPVRVVVRKNGQPAPLAWVRESYIGALAPNAPIPRAWMRDCIRLLVESNARRMPAGIEAGIEQFYATADAAGTKVTLGQPLPPGERTLDWARIHLLVTDPAYSGKLRVLLYNLAQGADPLPAFRNAFAKTPAEIDKQAGEHLAAGGFQTIAVGGRPLDPRRDFTPQPAPSPLPEIALADLRPTASGYEALRNVVAAVGHEGLGFMDLAANRTDDARAEFAAATEAGSTSARAWFELARLDKEKARAALEKAAALNPAWAEPHVLLAEVESDPSRKLNELKIAAQLDPRHSVRWRALAEFNVVHNRYSEAAKAWAAAEAASTNDAEREQIRQSRTAIEQQRLDYEAAERRRREEEKQRDLQLVKDAAMAKVRAAEARANAGAPAPPPNRKTVNWSDGPAPSGKLRGRLTQVECVRGVMRLVIQAGDGKLSRLIVRERSTVMASSGDNVSLACGAQRPVRTVAIEYFPKKDAKLLSEGEVATLEFATAPAAPAPDPEERPALPKPE